MKKRKYLPPIIAGSAVILYNAFVVVLISLIPAPVKEIAIVFAFITLIVSVLIIRSVFQRICEIKSGEEDDLYKY